MSSFEKSLNKLLELKREAQTLVELYQNVKPFTYVIIKSLGRSKLVKYPKFRGKNKTFEKSI